MLGSGAVCRLPLNEIRIKSRGHSIHTRQLPVLSYTARDVTSGNLVHFQETFYQTGFLSISNSVRSLINLVEFQSTRCRYAAAVRLVQKAQRSMQTTPALHPILILQSASSGVPPLYTPLHTYIYNTMCGLYIPYMWSLFVWSLYIVHVVSIYHV